MSVVFIIMNEAGDEFTSLIDGNSVGNAIPTVQRFVDLDVKQEYASGDSGTSPIRLRHEFTLSMDYVIDSTREQLLKWRFERQRVTLYDDVSITVTVARDLINVCQGRLYEITAVPSTPLILEDDTVWLGDIVFKQVKYTGTGVYDYVKEPI